ncbi:alpha-L-rhamnosidase [Paenibacillus algicola]|uniref:alpha-L-rhamnosidase n=1 Tax=Paenibacillus algicola TaxID=2565926 RepID=A0A4P8XJI1_9BACL|nr:family 78 glycoside hydrolase catalytic domain [Paenibacillus algicola]QCT01521.1 alpha-L-rhamnosidase [Paenibacillus algicola]
MDKVWSASWLMDKAFEGVSPPDNLFHKEQSKPVAIEHRVDLANRHWLIRKSFELDKSMKRAVLDITADDYYKLYINGHLAGQGPAQSTFDHYYYNRYDVTELLRPGPNVIAVHVYYHGLICRAYNSGDNRQGMIAELRIDDEVFVHTDSTWRCWNTEEYGHGEIIGYDTQFGEPLDLRLKQPEWKANGFDDSSWEEAVVQSTDHVLYLQPTPPVSVYEKSPVQIIQAAPGHYRIDFGEEVTGQVKFTASGQAGNKIEVRYGEELQDDGAVRYEMRCNCTYQEVCTLSGGVDEFEFFDYKAFRYVELLSYEPGIHVDLTSIAAIVRHYPMKEDACIFESSDSLLNNIWSICRNGVKYGSQEGYVDCPSREKGQYLGDNTIIAPSQAYLSGDLRLFRKALLDYVILSSKVCPGLMAVAPGHYMQEIADFSLQWPVQLLKYYKMSGDIQFLREMYPHALGILEHFAAYERCDGLLERVTDKWNLVDWPEGLRDGYDFDLRKPVGAGCHNVLNAFYYGAHETVAEISSILGECSDEQKLTSLYHAYIKTFYNEETGLFVDAEGSTHSSLHSNALALLFGLVPSGKKQPVIEFIRKKRLSCGVYMAYFVLKALTSAGEHELAYDLITSTDENSWATMIKEGATTCFESWSKEHKWNTSLCHPWASAPILILIEDFIGLSSAEPGWTKIGFNPSIPQALEAFQLEIETLAGRIEVHYKEKNIQLIVDNGANKYIYG